MLKLFTYLVLINILSFISMYVDKRKAILNKYRISEKTLFILAMLGGGIGIYIGMYTFRHKTQHLKFSVGIPVIIIINILCILYVLHIIL